MSFGAANILTCKRHKRQYIEECVECVFAERDQLREELNCVLAEWNALIVAVKSPTNGGAVGHARALATERDRYRIELENILNADHRKWEDYNDPAEFVAWAKSRARHALNV